MLREGAGFGIIESEAKSYTLRALVSPLWGEVPRRGGEGEHKMNRKLHIFGILTLIILLITGCSSMPAPIPEPDNTAVDTGERLSLADGTPVEIWETDTVTQYRTTEGIVFLEADRPAVLEELPEGRFYPDPVRPGQDFGFSKLTPEVQDAIRSHYEKRKSHFNLDKQLSKAWNIYSKYGQDPGYHPFHITWRYYPCAEGENILYVMTEEETIRDEWSTDTMQVTTAFDKATGEVIHPQDLFTCSKEELAEYMIHRSGLSNEEKMQDLIDRFSLQYLVIYPGQVYLWYPEGTLPDQTPAKYWLTFDEDSGIMDLFQPWARPDPPKTN